MSDSGETDTQEPDSARQMSDSPETDMRGMRLRTRGGIRRGEPGHDWVAIKGHDCERGEAENTPYPRDVKNWAVWPIHPE